MNDPRIHTKQRRFLRVLSWIVAAAATERLNCEQAERLAGMPAASAQAKPSPPMSSSSRRGIAPGPCQLAGALATAERL